MYDFEEQWEAEADDLYTEEYGSEFYVSSDNDLEFECWSHSVCTSGPELVFLVPFPVQVCPSWSDSWSDNWRNSDG